MRKYWIILKNQISLITAYRMELCTRWVMNFFDVVVNTALWSLLYAGNQAQIYKLIIYFALYYGLLNNITSGKVAGWISDDINSGDINNFLIKPINYPLVQVLKSLTIIIVRVLSPLLILILGNIFFPQIFAPISLLNLVLFLLFAILGFAIWNLMTITISTIAFRGTEIGSLMTTVDLILNLVKGAYIPAYLFSSSVTKVLSFTFVPYLASFQIKLYQETISISELTKALVVASCWIVFFSFTATYSYRRGLKIYEAQGS